MEEWQPIETAPHDGRVVRVRYYQYAPYHARWENGAWKVIEYFGPSRPTHWLSPNDPPYQGEEA